MKVLYIGPYRDGTGWAHAAHENILALDAAGVEVVPRALKLNNVNGEVSPRIKELEEQSDKGCDIVIQNSLPHHMDYSGLFEKNIAYYFTETSHFKNCSWAERLNLMDSGWVPCNDVLNSSRKSKVTIPLKVVPVPCDVSKYQKQYKKLEIPQLEDKFVFYTIGEVHRRKNLTALLKAFHLEFAPDEDVALMIKGSLPGMPASELDKHIGEMCNQVKENLKLYKNHTCYHSEIIISQYLDEVQMMRMHASGDCYVSPSYGEGWNLPAFDAMAMGKTPICTAQGAPMEFLLDIDQIYTGHGGVDTREAWGGWLVEAHDEPVFGMKETFADLFVGNEDWASIDVNELRKTMREAFTNHAERKSRSENGINMAYKYSHNVVGKQMKELLSE